MSMPARNRNRNGNRIRRWMLSLALPLLLCAPPAFAHAILLHSTPADQSIVHSRTVNLILDYNSRIDAPRSTLTLSGPGDQFIPLQREAGANPGELKATAENLASGTYRIHWQVLASDGHITRGESTFTVDPR
jgi:methionine-rich copper-binding protein CopC